MDKTVALKTKVLLRYVSSQLTNVASKREYNGQEQHYLSDVKRAKNEQKFQFKYIIA